MTHFVKANVNSVIDQKTCSIQTMSASLALEKLREEDRQELEFTLSYLAVSGYEERQHGICRSDW